MRGPTPATLSRSSWRGAASSVRCRWRPGPWSRHERAGPLPSANPAARSAEGSPVSSIGEPFDRADGALKVCGRARYAGDTRLLRMAHAVLVTSTVARGRITHIESAQAQAAAG